MSDYNIIFILLLDQREHLRCLIFTFCFHGGGGVGTRSTGAVLVAGAALESSAVAQQKHKVYYKS